MNQSYLRMMKKRGISFILTVWCLSSHGEFLGVLSSNFAIFQSTRRSPTREQRGSITTLCLVTLDIEILGVVDNSIYLLLF